MLLTHERELREVVAAFPAEIRLELLSVLAASPEERARAIAGYRSRPETHERAELLMDLEADRPRALDIMEALKDGLDR